MPSASSAVDALPSGTRRVLRDFVEATKGALGEDVLSIVLFGSGAEGRLRETSDVNVLVVLRRFDTPAVATLSAPLAAASAAVRLRAMFVLQSELAQAAGLFAVKFADIRHRHVVLHGEDPLASLEITRESELLRLRQVLLNLVLRLRQAFVESSAFEDRLVPVLAAAVGPLRVCAQLMLELEGRSTSNPKEALGVVAKELDCPSDLLVNLASAREQARLPPAMAPRAIVDLLALLEALRRRAERLV